MNDDCMSFIKFQMYIVMILELDVLVVIVCGIGKMIDLDDDESVWLSFVNVGGFLCFGIVGFNMSFNWYFFKSVRDLVRNSVRSFMIVLGGVYMLEKLGG